MPVSGAKLFCGSSVVTRTTGADGPKPDRILNGADILQFQDLARQVVIAEDARRAIQERLESLRPRRTKR